MTKQIIFILGLFSLSPLHAEPADKIAPLHAAVFDFSEGSAKYQGQGESIGKLLNAFLSTKDGIYLVERAEIEKLLGEQELSLSSQLDTSNSIKVGSITGAEVLVSGRVFGVGSKTYLVAKVISTETSKVFGATAIYGSEDGFDAAVSTLSDKISEVILKKGESLRVKRETHDELVDRLKTDLNPGGLKVYVNIPEKHLSRPVPDPACQTEIQKILKDCGFALTDKISEADLSITGEAFSQFASRRGNLISCRARAEIVIRNEKEDRLIRADRSTVGVVDIAEAVAGKSALQKAGRRLAENFIQSFKSDQ